MYVRRRISHCSRIRKERRPPMRMNSEPRKTDSWVNTIKKKPDTGKQKASITRKTDRKEIYFIWLCNMVHQSSTWAYNVSHYKNNLSVKLRCLEVLEACNSSTAKDVGFVLWLDIEIHRRSWNIMLFLNWMADILKTSLEIFKMPLDTVWLYSMLCCEVNQSE